MNLLADLVKLKHCSGTEELINLSFANEKAIDSLKALAEPIRLEIIESFSISAKRVCDLTQKTCLAQSKISYHLKFHKDAVVIKDKQSVYLV